MAETQVTGFKQIFADKKMQKAYEKTCYMNKDFEINTAAEREKLNTLFGEHGKYRASMTDDQISMMDTFIGAAPKKEVKPQEEDGSVTVYNNGENSSATVISGDNNTVVNGNVTNNNGQVAIGHDNEQNMNTTQETVPAPEKKEEPKNEKTAKEKAPAKKPNDKKDKPVEKQPLTDYTDLTDERERNSKREPIYIDKMPVVNGKRDLADFKKQVCAKLPKDLTWYDDMIRTVNSLDSEKYIISYLTNFGLKIKLVY